MDSVMKEHYYQALLDKNTEYEGVFYVGVKTTGVFCRPTCPARKPKLENCEFFETAEQALLASFRPCKRCRPLSHPNQVSELVQKLVDAVEAEPEKRWTEKDFAAMGVDVSTARRQFKKRFGMTFVENEIMFFHCIQLFQFRYNKVNSIWRCTCMQTFSHAVQNVQNGVKNNR